MAAGGTDARDRRDGIPDRVEEEHRHGDILLEEEGKESRDSEVRGTCNLSDLSDCLSTGENTLRSRRLEGG